MMVPATTLQLHLMAPSTIRALFKFRLALLFRAPSPGTVPSQCSA